MSFFYSNWWLLPLIITIFTGILCPAMVFISSHDWGSSLNAYDKVVVLDKTVIAIGTPKEVQNKLDDICCLKEKNLCDCD